MFVSKYKRKKTIFVPFTVLEKTLGCIYTQISVTFLKYDYSYQAYKIHLYLNYTCINVLFWLFYYMCNIYMTIMLVTIRNKTFHT